MASIVQDGKKDATLYMPVRELLESIGYTVHWDGKQNTVNLVTGSNNTREVAKAMTSPATAVINLKNTNTHNIANSGYFQAENNQVLRLEIASTIKGGTVDFFLFDPNGEERRITIGSENMAKEIPLTKGLWQYNCFGMFKGGGTIQIVGVIDAQTVEANSSNAGPSRTQDQIVEVDIPKLNADEYIALDLCDLQRDDKVTFNIQSNGKGVLFVGFMKEKDQFDTTYFVNGDFYGNKTGSVESSFLVNGFEGKYYFFVRNNGTEAMEKITGTVTIERE